MVGPMVDLWEYMMVGLLVPRMVFLYAMALMLDAMMDATLVLI